MKWTFVFYGRGKGAIGVSSFQQETVQADSHEAALLKLYDKYDHVEMARLVRTEEEDVGQ